MKKEFKQQFNEVFNKDNSIKNCGREETKKLIEISEKIDASIDFGNRETGFMNVENILKLNKSLMR